MSDIGGDGGRAPLAAIEVGSTGIRMLVASLDSSGNLHVLDRAGKPSRIGRDVFTIGTIGREAMREGIAMLSSFRELLKSYGISPAEAKVIGTSALREAYNREMFVDRVALQTGFKIRVVEDIEENHLMYLAVQYALQDERALLTKSNSMILEVGGGTTEIMLLRRGKMASTHSLRIGTLRLDEQMREAGAPQNYLGQYLASNIKTACDLLGEDLPLETVKTFIVIGSDARFAAYCVSGSNFKSYSILDRDKFVDFSNSISAMSMEECISTYHLPWAEAEGLASGLSIERMFLEKTTADSIVVPNVSIREGIILAEVLGLDPEVEAELRKQVVASAKSLGKRFRYDELHASSVSRLSLSIFDALAKDHGLGKHERMLLEVAAILHDIGTYIRSSSHHKHGEYIVTNSEIFGLNKEDLAIVSNVVRYHRRVPPAPTHVNFISLPREDRIVVMKLAAILRVADALDRSHSGRVADVAFERSEESFIMRPAQNLDWSLERLSLADKGDMFKDVFGLEPLLV